MDELAEAVIAGESPDMIERIPLPRAFPAAHVLKRDLGIFADGEERDVRRVIRYGEVPMPVIAPDEVLVAVMASAINYNTVWTATFLPVPTFDALRRFARTDGFAARHDLDHQVIGSDASGVIVRVGSAVRRWRVGDHVMVNPAYIDDQEAATHSDGMLGREQRAWGYETNFGGLAHYAVARVSQLVPKPTHLTWEEAGGITLCAGTAYRMLVGERAGRMKQGDIVLIWGAVGGLGSFAVQMVRNGGGIPVGVVGSADKVGPARRLGCEVVINRRSLGLPEEDLGDGGVTAGKILGRAVREQVGEDPHLVLDYLGQATFGMSTVVVRRGGTVVTCGSSTGYLHGYDNRYLWMNLKRIVGSHSANLQEAWECARLVRLGRISPTLSALY